MQLQQRTQRWHTCHLHALPRQRCQQSPEEPRSQRLQKGFDIVEGLYITIGPLHTVTDQLIALLDQLLSLPQEEVLLLAEALLGDGFL